MKWPLLAIILTLTVNTYSKPTIKLLRAIEWVESRNDPNAISLTSSARGCLQILKGTVEDVNRIKGGTYYSLENRFSQKRSYEMALVILTHYGRAYRKRTGREPTSEIYARIWKNGYAGLFTKPHASDHYWSAIKSVLKLQK